MNKKLFLPLFCLFVVMIGFGVTLPVLPFYAIHLHKTVGVSRETMAIHITLLTSIYALSQFIFAPFWGQWSDRIGRRPLILVGIAGSAITQMLFGLASSLTMLYVVRAIGGVLSSATIPATTAYIADITPDADLSRNMAWLGSAVSLGVIIGPALGGLTTREDLHVTLGLVNIHIENFALPFFLSAILMFLTLLLALRWLPESLSVSARNAISEKATFDWTKIENRLLILLGLTLAGQFGLSIFEGTFALYAQERFGYGPFETGIAFMVCGLVMAVFQVIAVGYLADRVRIISQVALGFGLMGTGILLLLVMRSLPLILGAISILSLGMALITPNLAALISKQDDQHKGALMGLQTATNSLGQVAGPFIGGVLFAWQASVPYLFAGFFLTGIGVLIGFTRKRYQRSFN
jgi:MFS transporter, DHA1 family, multidrug resistance protein